MYEENYSEYRACTGSCAKLLLLLLVVNRAHAAKHTIVTCPEPEDSAVLGICYVLLHEHSVRIRGACTPVSGPRLVAAMGQIALAEDHEATRQDVGMAAPAEHGAAGQGHNLSS